MKLARFFCAAILGLALYQLSESTADPDLWAHVMVGEHILRTGHLQQTEPYSWTAPGTPWINHELLAEISLGAAHWIAGGTGILLLKMAIGFLAFGIALKLGAEGVPWPERAVAWAVGGLAVVEISYGFAARPQIFTVLGLSIELWLLRKITRGKIGWALALPVLSALWVNTHGGVLAGLAVLVVTATVSSAQLIWLARANPLEGSQEGAPLSGSLPASGERVTEGGGTSVDVSKDPAPLIPSPRKAGRGLGRGDSPLVSQELRFASFALPVEPASGKSVVVLWLSCLLCSAALLVNPYGWELIRWTISGVIWLHERTELEEWRPTAPSWNHVALFVLALLALASFILTRRRRALWEMAVCAGLAVFAFRSVRHTPLFAIAALAFVPPHLTDVILRFRTRFHGLTDLMRRRAAQQAAMIALALITVAECAATFVLHKDHPLTMEVPRSQYPLGAISFIRDHGLRGNLLVFFDWGEQCLWELPDCLLSLDGRWETCYPRDLIPEHWKFYNGEPVNRKILDLDRADLALLPANLAGAAWLARQPGWQAVYFDRLAVVLVKNSARYPNLASEILPVAGPPAATEGRAAFPSARPARVNE